MSLRRTIVFEEDSVTGINTIRAELLKKGKEIKFGPMVNILLKEALYTRREE